MKIKDDSATSAREGIAIYTVAEEDRHVAWSIRRDQLDLMEPWDSLPAEERRDRQFHFRTLLGADFEKGPTKLYLELEAKMAESPVDRIVFAHLYSDWLGDHAIVARNALRNHLGLK